MYIINNIFQLNIAIWAYFDICLHSNKKTIKNNNL